VSEFNVRTFLMDRFPTDLDERLIYEAGPSAGPLTHAIARSLKLIEFGGCSCEFSTSSASARNAIADALGNRLLLRDAVRQCPVLQVSPLSNGHPLLARFQC